MNQRFQSRKEVENLLNTPTSDPYDRAEAIKAIADHNLYEYGDKIWRLFDHEHKAIRAAVCYTFLGQWCYKEHAPQILALLGTETSIYVLSHILRAIPDYIIERKSHQEIIFRETLALLHQTDNENIHDLIYEAIAITQTPALYPKTFSIANWKSKVDWNALKPFDQTSSSGKRELSL